MIVCHVILSHIVSPKCFDNTVFASKEFCYASKATCGSDGVFHIMYIFFDLINAVY